MRLKSLVVQLSAVIFLLLGPITLKFLLYQKQLLFRTTFMQNCAFIAYVQKQLVIELFFLQCRKNERFDFFLRLLTTLL